MNYYPQYNLIPQYTQQPQQVFYQPLQYLPQNLQPHVVYQLPQPPQQVYYQAPQLPQTSQPPYQPPQVIYDPPQDILYEYPDEQDYQYNISPRILHRESNDNEESVAM